MPGFCQVDTSPLSTAPGGPRCATAADVNAARSRPDRSDGAQQRSPAACGTDPERPDTPVPHAFPAAPARDTASAATSPVAEHHAPLGIFLTMSRRGLAAITVLLSMMLVVIHDLPAAASTLPEPEPTTPVQELVISEAMLAASAISVPLPTARDDFALSYYTPVQWPVDPSSTISSHFGYRAAPCAGCSTQHSGVDFTPGYGTPVHAVADGVVVSRPMSGWGSYVVLESEVDGQTVLTGYAHLVSGSAAPVGTTVARGDVIGRVGNTGESSGAHLHFSVIIGGTFVEPLAWLRSHVTEPF